MARKITIIGGGSSTFTPQLMHLFIASEALRGSTITLMDIDAHRLEVMDILSRMMVAKAGADLKVESTTDRRQALTGADFVISAISVGGNDAWEKDIEIPASYGIFMPVQDSVGPGGMMRAFRHIPALVSVAKDLEQVSPKAWVFNYTNPLTANVTAMRRASSIRTVGLCTGSDTPRNAGYLAEDIALPPEELAVPAPAAGLNHCSAILRLELRDGRDAFPLFKERATYPVTRWGLETFGILPYPSSHWVEFFPALCRLDDKYQGRAQGLKMLYNKVHNVQWDRERAQGWAALAERLARGEEEFSPEVLPKDESIQVVEIIEALLTNRNAIHAVNVPNNGAIANLPGEAIVEVSSAVGSYGVRPLQVGELPEAYAATLRQHVTVQQLTVEAALTGDRQVALQAFLQDPQIAARLTVEETGKMLDELLKAHAAYLPQFA